MEAPRESGALVFGSTSLGRQRPRQTQHPESGHRAGIHQVGCELQSGDDVALQIYVVVDVGFAGRDIRRGQEQRSQCARMLENDRGACLLWPPLVAGPSAHPGRRVTGDPDEEVVDSPRGLESLHVEGL